MTIGTGIEEKNGTNKTVLNSIRQQYSKFNLKYISLMFNSKKKHCHPNKDILFRPFRFIALKILNHLSFSSTDFERS
jgi:hypothetical protein